MDTKAAAARRRVLGLLGAAAGTAAGGAHAISRDGQRQGEPNRAEAEAEKRQARYRETPHVQAFYRTNRN
jgi:hypothetical protein